MSTKTFKYKFPEKKYQKLSENNALGSNPTAVEIRKVFLQGFEVYLDGKMSIDDFSLICGRLFSLLTKIKNEKDLELIDALVAGDELRFYFRKENLLGGAKGFLKSIFEYHTKHSK